MWTRKIRLVVWIEFSEAVGYSQYLLPIDYNFLWYGGFLCVEGIPLQPYQNKQVEEKIYWGIYQNNPYIL